MGCSMSQFDIHNKFGRFMIDVDSLSGSNEGYYFMNMNSNRIVLDKDGLKDLADFIYSFIKDA